MVTQDVSCAAEGISTFYFLGAAGLYCFTNQTLMVLS
jgi:hypothetical protein